MSPKRIQRKRTKGWRMPEGAVYVGRPTRWGNPFNWFNDQFGLTRAGAVERYRGLFDGSTPWPYLYVPQPTIDEVHLVLAGKDLACWCPLDQPCHADVLLELANDDGRRDGLSDADCDRLLEMVTERAESGRH